MEQSIDLYNYKGFQERVTVKNALSVYMCM